MMIHTCDAVIVCCIDFRLQKYIRNWIDKNLIDKKYDYVGLAGATKDFTTALNQIEISSRLHKIKRAILIHHEDCGAYGKEGTPRRHSQDLLKAKKEILSKHPNLKVLTYYLHLNGDFEEIS